MTLAGHRLIAGGGFAGVIRRGRFRVLRFVVEPVGTGRHDDVTCLCVVLKPMLRQQRDKLLAVEIGKVIKRQHTALGKLQHHPEADIFKIAKIISDLQPVERLIDALRLTFNKLDSTRLKLLGDAFVKSLDRGKLLDRGLGNLLRKDKPLCNKKMRNHIIDVQRLDKAGRAGPELFLTAL